ncbi:probable N-acetyltransferase camello [Amia ocellicauda]|uniref:probable N-acetyltransferase camello n=1 Tax=Amia ocellicauda TaxID=2972642 RepID=UPI003463E51F|nr:CMLO acetyltransferase [Amia calva]
MTSFKIRKYQDEDYEMVKDIFTMGMSEHVPASFVHMLKQPIPQMFIMCVFCALLASSKSVILPVLAVTLLLAGTRQGLSYMFNSYIERSLKEDMGHIGETYVESKHCCFWVVESEGSVVATVACVPSSESGSLQLKRLSVRRSHRGRGFAKALCRTVEEFAREKGYEAVILFTSVVQYDAHKLYENLGYIEVRQMVAPTVIAKITNFTIRQYRYDLLKSN